MIYPEGGSPETLGLYNTVRRVPAGPAVDPGVPANRTWTDGRRALILGGDGTELRTIDLVAGEVIEPSFDFDSMLMDDIVLDGDHFYVPTWDFSGDAASVTVERRLLDTGEVVARSAPGFTNVATGGGIVMASTYDGRVVELDPLTLDTLGLPFPGTNGNVIHLGIDRAGRRLMLHSEDQTLRFYDIPTRTPLGDPIDSANILDYSTASLRPDGMAAATVTGQGIVFWDLDPAHWQEAACRLAGRNLTRAEWDEYIGDLAPYTTTCPGYPATA